MVSKKIKEIRERFGESLRIARQKRKMSQDYLAKVLVRSQGHISEVESGKRDLNVAELFYLIETIGISYAEIDPLKQTTPFGKHVFTRNLNQD